MLVFTSKPSIFFQLVLTFLSVGATLHHTAFNRGVQLNAVEGPDVQRQSQLNGFEQHQEENMDNINKPNNDTFGTLLKWGLGITAVYCLLPPDVKENVGKFLYQLSDAMVANQRRKA